MPALTYCFKTSPIIPGACPSIGILYFAAKNYEALKSLINSHPYSLMFCTDDSHPGDLIHCGHIDKIVRRAIADGFDLFQVLRIASLHPIQHYRMNHDLKKLLYL